MARVGDCKGEIGRQPVTGDGADCEPIGRPECGCSSICLYSDCGSPLLWVYNLKSTDLQGQKEICL